MIRILIADDHAIVRRGLKQILDEAFAGVVCGEAGNAEETVAAVRQHDWDLVILDMIMPSVSGGDTYDRLKAMNPKVKVILSSGYSLNAQAAKIIARGCNGFIQKPFNINDLSQKIRQVLEQGV